MYKLVHLQYEANHFVQKRVETLNKLFNYKLLLDLNE